MVDFKISNALDPGGVDKFLATINQYGAGPAQACRYLVSIGPIPLLTKYSTIRSELPFLCEQAEIPGKTYAVHDARYYGPNFKYPVQVEFSDVTLTFIVRDEMLEKEFFDNWMMTINPSDSYDFNYKKSYVSQIDIVQYSVIKTGPSGPQNEPNKPPLPSKVKPTFKVTLRDAFPTSIAPMGLVWGEEGFHRIAVTFAYTELIKINDPPRAAYTLIKATANEPAAIVTGSVLGEQSSYQTDLNGKGDKIRDRFYEKL